MQGKDDRSKENRKHMKQHNHYKPLRRGGGGGGSNSGSSPQGSAAVRSIVDVADSSDEPRVARKGNWGSGRKVPEQQNRDLLDTLPPEDDDDMEQYGIEVSDVPLDDNARAQLRAGNFKQMSQYPNLGGGHFTFGSEKEWHNADVEGQGALPARAAANYFTLNLTLLNCGLQTIPFYKRMDFDNSMFSRKQIDAMNQTAERAERSYQKLLLRTNSNGGNPSRMTSAKSTAAAEITKSEQPPAAALADELDELLAMTNEQLQDVNITTTAVTPTPTPAPALPIVQPPTPITGGTPEGKSDVEQWLDSVLDE